MTSRRWRKVGWAVAKILIVIIFLAEGRVVRKACRAKSLIENQELVEKTVKMLNDEENSHDTDNFDKEINDLATNLPSKEILKNNVENQFQQDEQGEQAYQARNDALVAKLQELGKSEEEGKIRLEKVQDTLWGQSFTTEELLYGANLARSLYRGRLSDPDKPQQVKLLRDGAKCNELKRDVRPLDVALLAKVKEGVEISLECAKFYKYGSPSGKDCVTAHISRKYLSTHDGEKAAQAWLQLPEKVSGELLYDVGVSKLPIVEVINDYLGCVGFAYLLLYSGLSVEEGVEVLREASLERDPEHRHEDDDADHP